MKKLFLLLTLSLFTVQKFNAQEITSESEWDNLFYFGNKVTWGESNWRNSAELQFRLQSNTQQLQQYFVEYVGTYLISKNFEIAPDFRLAVKPNRVDYRPGFGLVFKNLTKKGQFVHQVKWQIDIESTGGSTQTLRYFPSYNHVINEHWMVSGFVGGYYKLEEQKNDFSAFIGGIGGAFIINKQHTLNLSYLYGQQQNFNDASWSPVGGFILRLIININKNYIYVPARYLNF